MRFVRTVEEAKGYVPDPDKIFRHMASELGELDGAMHARDSHSWPEGKVRVDPQAVRASEDYFKRLIGFEILDLIFLCCYMADVYGVELNQFMAERIDKICKDYNVLWPKEKK